MKCRICDSEEHLMARCPQNKGKGKGRKKGQEKSRDDGGEDDDFEVFGPAKDDMKILGALVDCMVVEDRHNIKDDEWQNGDAWQEVYNLITRETWVGKGLLKRMQ